VAIGGKIPCSFIGISTITMFSVEFECAPEARDLIVAEGYDPVYGARPLRRAIQTLIQNPLAVSMLKGDILSGQKVKVFAENGEIKFTTEGEQKAATKA